MSHTDRSACAYEDTVFFFFNDTATTEIYTLSLHDALPICLRLPLPLRDHGEEAAIAHHLRARGQRAVPHLPQRGARSEEHTSELQSRQYLVCRLLLEKKKTLLHHHLLPHPIFPPHTHSLPT